MPDFPHLKLYQRVNGLHKPVTGGSPPKKHATTLANLKDRRAHGSKLMEYVDSLSTNWDERSSERKRKGLPDLSDAKPIFLQVDTNLFDIESLKSFGVEIIAEEEGGYIIGASGDNFHSLKEKISKFLKNEHNQASQLWKIVTGDQWRIDQILSEELREKWGQIQDQDEFYLDIGIACYVKTATEPINDGKVSPKVFLKRHNKWKAKFDAKIIEQTELAMHRQEEFESLVHFYNGEIIDSEFVEFDDSFCCRIRINGAGLKDIVLTYQYLFEVTEYDSFSVHNPTTGVEDTISAEFVSPDSDSPKICVIDSGINEGHRLLASAIVTSESRSYVPNDLSTADGVANGGHGTRVAGAVLFSNSIPRTGTYKHPFFIFNARVLDNRNAMSSRLYPPILMENITLDFDAAKIFNLSINSWRACRTTHMSQWASTIDKLMYEDDRLFIISAGNLQAETKAVTNPGIKDYLAKPIEYPHFLLENASRIANPGQSCFALTVGSVCIDQFEDDNRISFGKRGMPSSFTRTGLGLWGIIKPDVVEFGGDWIREKNANPNLTIESRCSPELVKTGMNAVGRDDIGTSFAAPKVTHIAGQLQKLFPSESALMYRALIAQSARLPLEAFEQPSLEHIKYYGYGIPHLKRASENSEKRITFITDGKVASKQANTYRVKIPKELFRPGLDYKILIEVTLSYSAKPRRTRRGTKSYLSTWLDWESSKFNESYDQFVQRVIKNINSETPAPEDADSIAWKIWSKNNWGEIKDLKRNDSSLQKDWTIIESNRLSEEFCIAVIGHQGWQNKLSEEASYALAVSFEVLNEEAGINIYQMIEAVNIEVEQQVELQSNPGPK